jgi:hypothetical protein
MTKLEQAAIDFFTAILETGTGILGHSQFMFKIDATISTKPEDAERAPLIGQRLQEAMNIANDLTKKAMEADLIVKGTTLQ